MKTEDYQKLEAILKRGKANELKRVKKEQLLEYISDYTQNVAKDKEAVQDELNTAKLIVENFESSQETIDEYKKLLEELKTKNSSLYTQVNELQETTQEAIEKFKIYRGWTWVLGGSLLVAALIVLFLFIVL